MNTLIDGSERSAIACEASETSASGTSRQISMVIAFETLRRQLQHLAEQHDTSAIPVAELASPPFPARHLLVQQLLGRENVPGRQR
jgi:hypothetical protein